MSTRQGEHGGPEEHKPASVILPNNTLTRALLEWFDKYGRCADDCDWRLCLPQIFDEVAAACGLKRADVIERWGEMPREHVEITQEMVERGKLFMLQPVRDDHHSPTGDPWVAALLDTAINGEIVR